MKLPVCSCSYELYCLVEDINLQVALFAEEESCCDRLEGTTWSNVKVDLSHIAVISVQCLQLLVFIS